MTWIERLNRDAAGRIPVGANLTVEVLHWAYHPHLPDNVLHRHTYFEVCLVGAWGSGQFRVGQGAAQSVSEIEPGSVFIARPGVVHQITNTGGDNNDNNDNNGNMELLWLSFHAPPASGPGDKPRNRRFVRRFEPNRRSRRPFARSVRKHRRDLERAPSNRVRRKKRRGANHFFDRRAFACHRAGGRSIKARKRPCAFSSCRQRPRPLGASGRAVYSPSFEPPGIRARNRRGFVRFAAPFVPAFECVTRVSGRRNMWKRPVLTGREPCFCVPTTP